MSLHSKYTFWNPFSLDVSKSSFIRSSQGVVYRTTALPVMRMLHDSKKSCSLQPTGDLTTHLFFKVVVHYPYCHCQVWTRSIYCNLVSQADRSYSVPIHDTVTIRLYCVCYSSNLFHNYTRHPRTILNNI